ncbi:hypothetical protein Tco_1113591 [Tanacetum coccineum]|uniref:Reverse transcriptase domain-containing protein n=1 Tax=Tanacetum coccineum TaxID=301880 RepID=A0ABQ5IVB5_9ASTR
MSNLNPNGLPGPIPQNPDNGPPGPNPQAHVPELQIMEELCQPTMLGDDANKHIDKFLTVTQNMKQNGVLYDILRSCLFPYSLTHHATAWFDCLPKNCIHSWEEMVTNFLSKYFPPSMLSIDRCPNHNMLPVTQIDTFYNGLTLRHRDTINTAAGGTFMKRRPEESALTQQIAEMNKNFLRMSQSNQQVNVVNPSCETCGGSHHYSECQDADGFTQGDVYAATENYNAGGTASRLRPYHFTYPERELTMEEMLYKFIDEGKREHEEMRAFICNDFKDFEKEFPAIVYNVAQISKLNFLTEPTLSPQHINEFNLKDETSLSECNEEEQNVLNFNDLFLFNVVYPDDLKSDKDNDDDKIDIENSSGDLSVKPLPDVINNDVGSYAHGSNKLLETTDMAYPNPMGTAYQLSGRYPIFIFSTVYTAYLLNEYSVFDTGINTAYPREWIRRILGNRYGILTFYTVLGPRERKIDNIGDVFTNLEILKCWSLENFKASVQHEILLINATWRIYLANIRGVSHFNSF